METLGHVLLEMNTNQVDFLVRNRDVFLGVFRIGQIMQRHAPVRAERHVILRNLIVLWHVGIEIIFAIEFGDIGNIAIEHKSR